MQFFLRALMFKPQHLARRCHQRPRARREQQQVLAAGLCHAHVGVVHVDGGAQYACKRRAVLHCDQYCADTHEVVRHCYQHRLAALCRPQRPHVDELHGIQGPIGLAAKQDGSQVGTRIALQREVATDGLDGLRVGIFRRGGLRAGDGGDRNEQCQRKA
ncbi:hypothetical protein D3C72_1548660 [compost metagenome]